MAELAVRYRGSGGQPLISVTQVLQLAGRIDVTWFTAEAARRGQIVHDLTEAFDYGWDLEIPPGLEGYLDAYATFMAVVKPVYSDIELAVTNDLLGLGGRIDRVCLDIFGSPGILDFKTSPHHAWHGQQLAFYNLLHPTGTRWACYLRKDGSYRLRQFEDPLDHRKNMFDLARVRGSVTPHGDYWIQVA